jgi:hypothetical protein
MGAITLTSGSNSAAVLVSLKFSANVSSDIEVLNTEFTDYRANLTEQETTTYASLITDIDSDITTAQNYASSGNMDSAKQRFDSAETKFEMFRNVINLGGAEPGTGQPLDMTLVMMVGAAVAVVVIVVLVLKRRGRGGESKEEAEGGEEFEENIEGEEL